MKKTKNMTEQKIFTKEELKIIQNTKSVYFKQLAEFYRKNDNKHYMEVYFPLINARHKRNVIIFGSIFLFFIIISLLPKSEEKDQVIRLQKNTESHRTETKSYESVKNSEWDGSVSQVKKYMMSNLRDPDSYDPIEWSPVVKKNNQYIVRHKYRAKNGFGGLNIENKIFTLNSNGEVISVK